jgi:cytochrome c peroxidase
VFSRFSIREVLKMQSPRLVMACSFVFLSLLVVNTRHAAVSAAQDGQAEHAPARPFDCGTAPCDAIARGSHAFFDRQLSGLGGNGRACADCHMATDSFQLSPAAVEERFQLLASHRLVNHAADDPLFRPIDADDFRTNGDDASDFSNLRQNALVRIVFPLPPNMRLVDTATGHLSAETAADVWRMVPSINNVALSGPDTGSPWFRPPNPFGGYQLDARIGTLQDQALGALVNHAQVQQTPSSRLLDDLTSFELVQFSNDRMRLLADAIRDGITPPDADAPLNELEQQGRTVFERACTQCHGGPTQTTARPPVPRFQDVNTQCPRPVDTVAPARWQFAACPPRLARNSRTYEIIVNGVAERRTSDDPGRALLTGFVGGPAARDDWNKLDVPQLRGLPKTAPYFHNNSAATLEEVVDHYIAFFKRLQAVVAPGAPPQPAATTDGVHFDRLPLPEEREALLAYLRTL